ncbi:outer membrane beta-barrel protein [Candidatus Symbiothrix dinenymphae]|uniref:outer membrane beta-barrel protein n=1 Tax=Candidatus Symbiothrix dinenymphae TaxID=467085 RepID=UPI0006C0FA83|nr:outer membrane beta-barrel protein [Candidatus Symbiothrix dinenymphae]GAP72173.1 hypothetical protein SAMD00024442_26_23 [Candidatus Symbiothrix dinenymphae]
MKHLFFVAMTATLIFTIFPPCVGAMPKTEPADGTTQADSTRRVTRKAIKPKRKLPKITLTADLGYGWRDAKINAELNAYEKAYYENLMLGLVVDASVHYYLNDYYGVGLIYAAHHANHSQYSSLQYGDGSSETGIWKTNNAIRFIGPAFLLRMPVGRQKWLLEASIGLGYAGYSSKETFENQSANMYGSTLGGRLTLGAEYKVDAHWAIGARLSEVVGAATSRTKATDGYKKSLPASTNERIGLGQFQLLAGVRYYFK